MTRGVGRTGTRPRPPGHERSRSAPVLGATSALPSTRRPTAAFTAEEVAESRKCLDEEDYRARDRAAEINALNLASTVQHLLKRAGLTLAGHDWEILATGEPVEVLRIKD